MDPATVAVAMAAGVLAAFNPCGIALLPTYLAIFLGHDDDRNRSPVARALAVGSAVTLGFLVVFGVAGLLVSALAVSLGDWLSVLTGVSGILLFVAGVAILTGREISVNLPRANLRVDGSPKGMVAYGVVYATVSLSCTLPVFLAVVVSVFSSGPGADGGWRSPARWRPARLRWQGVRPVNSPRSPLRRRRLSKTQHPRPLRHPLGEQNLVACPNSPKRCSCRVWR